MKEHSTVDSLLAGMGKLSLSVKKNAAISFKRNVCEIRQNYASNINARSYLIRLIVELNIGISSFSFVKKKKKSQSDFVIE